MNAKGKNLRKILVTTDFSETSDHALSRAVEIAKANKADLTILHVIQTDFFYKYLELAIPKVLVLAPKEYMIKNSLQETVNLFSNQQIKINYVIISSGKPAIKIMQYAKKNKVDLLVMGAHGKYSIRDTFVGTTAEYVAKKTQCPVLIVKNRPRKLYNKILVPVDFSRVSKKALNYAIHLFPHSNFRLIHVGDYEYEDLLQREEHKESVPKNKIIKMRKAILLYLNNKMKKFIKGYSNRLDKSPYNITLGYPGPTIIKEAAKLHRDLIVMGTQGHGRIHYLFIGSVASLIIVGPGLSLQCSLNETWSNL